MRVEFSPLSKSGNDFAPEGQIIENSIRDFLEGTLPNQGVSEGSAGGERYTGKFIGN
ncbi:MAG: hypothetical protein GYA15_01895 [Leptolinea sp.]|jgi:hypothetical protein|nr:hypothetical protein [Leptolinea sp.]